MQHATSSMGTKGVRKLGTYSFGFHQPHELLLLAVRERSFVSEEVVELCPPLAQLNVSIHSHCKEVRGRLLQWASAWTLLPARSQKAEICCSLQNIRKYAPQRCKDAAAATGALTAACSLFGCSCKLRLRAALDIVIGLDVNEDSSNCSRWPKAAKVKVQLEPIQRIYPWASARGQSASSVN